MHEGDEPDALADIFSIDTEPAAARDLDGFVAERIPEFTDTGVGAVEGLIELSGRFHVERLIWPFPVELLEEGIEACLLLQKDLFGGLGGFFLGVMHELMTPVLLRSVRLDPLDGDPEL
jgi:hypothetical protein